MSQHYSNQSREASPYSLPDVETFEAQYADCPSCGTTVMADRGPWVCDDCAAFTPEASDIKWGWFWHSCFPGCLPDSDPMGPFATEADALDDAREGMDEDDTDRCPACGVAVDDCRCPERNVDGR